MPTLNWIGKEAVVNHHQQVPFQLLKDVPDLSCGEPGTGNLIVQGDNLVALKALLPYYAGQVKCIYIDPPYNTGDENWIYNDNVNSPVIRDWLGQVVGKEGETLDRFRLRDEIEARIQQHREHERQVAFQGFLLPDSALAVSPERAINFRTMTYEPSWLYEGGFRFEKHYFGPKPGELQEKRAVGAVWASRSEGRCLFVMPTEGDFSGINRMVKP